MENQDGSGLIFKSITMLNARIHYKVLKMLEEYSQTLSAQSAWL